MYIGNKLEQYPIFNLYKKYIIIPLLYITPLLLVIIFFSGFVPLKKIQSRYMIGIYKRSSISIIHQWISQNTPKDALFISFPSDFSFQAEAKRPLIIGYKSFIIYNSEFTINWYNNFCKTYNIDTSYFKYNNNLLSISEKKYNLYPPLIPKKTNPKNIYIIVDTTKSKYYKYIGEPVYEVDNYKLILYKSSLL